jgi:hypothetical protein
MKHFSRTFPARNTTFLILFEHLHISVGIARFGMLSRHIAKLCSTSLWLSVVKIWSIKWTSHSKALLWDQLVADD